MSKLSWGNPQKIALIIFAQNFHLYVHASALLLQGRGLSLFQIGLIGSIVNASVFIMEVPTGLLADRFGRKGSLIAACVGLMSGEIMMLFAGASFPLYVLLAFLTGTGFAFLSGAAEALIYDSLPLADREANMKRTMGMVGSAGGIAFTIAPLIGGVLIGEAQPQAFILPISLTILALAGGILVAFTLDEAATQPDKQSDTMSAVQILREGLRTLANNPPLRRWVWLAILTTPFHGELVVNFAAPYLVSHQVHPFVVGVTLSIGSLLAAVTQRYAYQLEKYLGQERTLWCLLLLPGCLYLVLAWASGTILPVIILIVMYGTNNMKAPLFSAYQNRLIASRERATVLSLISMGTQFYITLLAPLYAWFGQYSLRGMFVLIGMVIIVMTVYLIRKMPSDSLMAR